MDLELLKLRILDRYPVDELVEVLGITVEDIVEMFEDKIVRKQDELDV